jgi:tetratricopeptide (TPR) repeat protein
MVDSDMDDFENSMRRLFGTMEATQVASTNTFDISHQLELARENKVPECYNASGRYCPFTAMLAFTGTFANQERIFANEKMYGATILQSARPAIEHGVVPSCFQDLRHVTIQDVVKKVNHIHTDCVMLLESIHEPYRQVGTNLLVEDLEGDCILLSLYNYVGPEENPKDVFPVGMRFALLAPYMKNSQDDPSKSLMLRCDNPQCVVLYSDENYIWKRSTSTIRAKENPWALRQKGNEEFMCENLQAASMYYTQALIHPDIDEEVFSSDKVACFSNRAEVNLREEQWNEAMKDAEAALSLQADHTKAKLRLAKALSRLGRSSEALVLAQELLEQGSQDRSSVDKFVKECSRLVSEEVGTYNYDAMNKEARIKQAGARIPFHANFESPKVQIGVTVQCPSGTSYRGCMATSDLQAGELVVASKAFAYAKKLSSDLCFEVNAYEKSLGEEHTVELVGQVVRLLWKSPSLGESFYSLSAGEHLQDARPDAIDKIDLPRIRAILGSNSFALQSDSNITLNWKKMHSTIVPDLKDGSGVWIKESMFNHSCTPNCTWSQIGDHMFISTTREVKKDEELCILYSPLEKSHDERTEIFQNWIKHNVGFVCACDHCHLFRKRDDLRRLAAEVDKAYGDAAKEVTLKGTSMAEAAESMLPSQRRTFIMDQFAHLSPRLQHTSIAKLHVLEGSVLSSRGDDVAALKSYQRAADIGYAVRGSATLGYLTDLWRIAGSSMACRKVDLALKSLRTIWKHSEFQRILSPGEAKAAFTDFSLKYTMPWWVDEYDIQRQRLMESMIRDVCNGKKHDSSQHRRRQKKKKKVKS